MSNKSYTPQEIEQKYYKLWEKAGAFSAQINEGNPPYCVIMPPANVTGTLHLGHALTFTIQDILVRYHRMLGKQTLWQPGTDHAGIATQIVVEKHLKAQGGPDRHALGREAFLEKVWEWKDISGGTIIEQLKRLGASADWSRERFTMDEPASLAVTKVFVDLFKQGLIYRDKRLVNWDCALQSAISDLEVDPQEIMGTFYHVKYLLEEDPTKAITVATTRPETLFGDVAVAVHPDDPKYQAFIGKRVRVPLTDRTIPIIADTHSDPEKGTGAVKITPAHDFNDFEVGQRHGLEAPNILNVTGCLEGDMVPEAYHGLTVKEARSQVRTHLEEAGLLVKTEERLQTVPVSDRSGTVIEPMLTDQWFVDAKTLAQPAIEAVETGKTTFVPDNWQKNYFEWMRNIQPWCVSRQIWWGHQIPAYYGPDGHIFVAETHEEAVLEATQHYGKVVELMRDPDVLDTWFSSALWPFTTMGWPHQTKELNTFYPSAVLVTGFDIIFFWVARMMMMGIHFMKQVPFKDVYIHALVRDEHGQKMSKSKGNVIDPLELIDAYGADALRFTLASLASPGRDVKLSAARVESTRNFATKLWNAARYLHMNDCKWEAFFDPHTLEHGVNRWVVALFKEVQSGVTEALDSYNIHTAAQALYQFAWKVFCDWYLELSKPLLQGEDTNITAETRKTLGYIFGKLLHLLHPMMPFITEELWASLGGEGLLITAQWPVDQEKATDAPQQVTEIEWLLKVITALRSLKAEMNIAPGAHLFLYALSPSEAARRCLTEQALILEKVGRVASISMIEDPQAAPEKSLQVVVQDQTFFIPVEGLLDVAAEKKRLDKICQGLQSDIAKMTAKLSNESFMARAPMAIIEETRQRLSDLEGEQDKVAAALKRLEQL